MHVASRSEDEPAKVGFVVTKALGPAVRRNRVKRRLRTLMGPRLGAVPAGALLVVRATPQAVTASFDELAADLDRCLARVGLRAP